MATYGLDISENNDRSLSQRRCWQAIRDSKFKDFIIIRMGYGVNPERDEKFLDYYYRAKEFGFTDISAYWFSYATNKDEAKREAHNFIEMTEKLGVGLTHMIMDFENNDKFVNRNISITKNFATTQVQTFLGELKAAGLNCGLYASEWIINDLLGLDWFVKNGIFVWNAQYGKTDDVKAYMWQFTSEQYIEGFGPFDANMRY